MSSSFFTLYSSNVLSSTVLDYEPNNKTAKDFYPQLQAKVNEQIVSSNSDGSDENCNYTSSLDYVDNEILDNDLDAHNNSYVSSASSSESSDDEDFVAESLENSSCDDDVDPCERDDLLNSLSHSSSRSSNSSKSDQLPESMSSNTTSSDSRRNTSHSLSFTSLLLDDSNDFTQPLAETANGLESSSAPKQDQSMSSPFTKKIIQLFK